MCRKCKEQAISREDKIKERAEKCICIYSNKTHWKANWFNMSDFFVNQIIQKNVPANVNAVYAYSISVYCIRYLTGAEEVQHGGI